MSPFDFVKSVTYDKKYIYSDDTKKEYVPYIINKSLSSFIDTVFYANEMNMLPDLDSRLQYDYFINSIRKSKRFSSWYKRNKDDELKITIVQKFYGYSRSKAKEALSILSDDQFKIIKEKIEKGDKNE